MWSEPILHVDMDSFFVEVERLFDSTLVGKAVAVGGPGPRGVIASASYEAREFGVHSAQPTSIALQACPSLIIVPAAHGRYAEVSTRVFELFRRFTPLVEGLSLDEAFLDVSGLRRHYSSPLDVGHAIRSSIRDEMGLPASVGVASTKFVAKLASDAAKPDGMRHVSSESQVMDFLRPLPADALWGVGPATLASLKRMGIQTVGDIAEMPEASLVSALGRTLGSHLFALANGIDPRKVVPDQAAKSVSVEQTYEKDLVGLDVIESALLAHAQRLSGRLQRSGLVARTVVVKLRYDDFETPTRSHTQESALSGARELFQVASNLLPEFDLTRPVRLLGLGASNLVEASEPRQLGIGDSEEWDRVEEAVHAVREKFGDGSVAPARLIGEDRPDEEPS